jgi:hypothetical protein
VTHDERIARGRRAQRLLDDADVKQAFADVSAQLFQDWCLAAPEQREGLHAVYRAQVRLIDQLESWRNDALIDERR